MAAPAVARSFGPPLCPCFAEVCSFLERYGPALDLPDLTFPQMERYLRDTTAVPKPLVDLHVKLLRKLGKSVTTDRWEKYLAKVCQELNSTWAWELEQKGYQDMSMECKSSILKYLCECQFDENLKFKMMVNDEDPEKMRLQPIGRDRQGLMYWLQLDQEQNIRLYTEEQDDLDGSTWKCIVRTRNDLAEALELLKAQVKPNPGQDQKQAGSRSNSPAVKDPGDDDDLRISNVKLPQTTEEQTDEKIDRVKKEEAFKEVVKQEETPPVKQEIPDSEVKEEKEDLKPAAFDNRVSTITAVKSEHRDADGPKNTVPVVMAPSVILTKMNKVEEAERAVVRSNQQAKIPLKKRDLKLADSFHSNHLNNSSSSSIIVCNPAVISSKDVKLLNSLAHSGSPASSQQQLVVTAARQELTNGRTSHLPHKEGQNGVIGVKGQVGAVGHVGVIRSPSEYHRAAGSEQQELNGPSPEPCRPRAKEVEKEVSRQSVLVRKGPTEGEAPPPATSIPPQAAIEDQVPPKPQSSSVKPDGAPEATERKVDSVGITSLSADTESRRRTEEEQDKITTEESEKRREQKDEMREEESRRPGTGEEPGKNSNTSEKVDSESSSAVPSVKINKQDQQGEGVNGGLVSRVRVKNIGSGSEPKQTHLEEVSSELQKEGIRLKIKIPPHRRNKLRKKGGKEEEKDREPEVQEEGRSLRRSVRICRSSALPNCRPSSKAAESQRKKPQKKQALPVRTREEEEAEEEEGGEEEQRSSAAKDRKAEPAGKFRKRRGKRRHGRPRWTVVRSKRRKPNEEEEVEDRGCKVGEEEEEEEEEEEGGSNSEEESYKSEEIPREDACTHCGLPNHPELILLCDSCDGGYHTACLRPPLMLIPDGEWFCPPCQHKMLCEKLEEQLQNLDSALKKRERAERRRERLVYVGISVENIIPEGDEEEEEEKTAKQKDSKKSKNLGRRSTRTRKHISYRFDDFDDAIDEAIEEDIRDLCGAGAGRGKDIPPVPSEDGKQNQRPVRNQTRSARSRKKRRLNDLESDSTAVESEDEFMLSNSSEEEDFGASGADDDGEEEDEDAGSDAGSSDRGTRPRRGVRGVTKYKPRKTQRRGRKRRRRRSAEEEEEEDSDIEMDSDQFSDMTDSDAEKKRRGLRRGQRQQVNYRETSESSASSRASSRREKVARRGRPRKEHLSSDYSDVSPSSRDSEEDYEDEDEDDQKKRASRRRREDREERRRRYQDKKNVGDRGRRLKRRQLEKEEDKDKRRRLTRTDREEEDLEKMGRGKRREMLSQQRRKRLAQMLKKQRPSTDEEDDDEEESQDSESSSEDDRPIRKRLNRIDSDDEEDEDEGPRMMNKKSSVVERRAENRNDSDVQEKGRGQSLSPSNGHQTSRDSEKPGTGSPAEPRDSAGSGRRERHNGPLDPGEEEEEGQSDSVNSVLNGPRS